MFTPEHADELNIALLYALWYFVLCVHHKGFQRDNASYFQLSVHTLVSVIYRKSPTLQRKPIIL